jgi:glycosyltransferase involved in cell wall biosynthesis
MRIAVHTDYSYRRDGEAVFAERAFVLFLIELSRSFEGTVVLGRLDPKPGRSHYRLPDDIEFVGLPHYSSLLQPLRVALATLRSIRRFWTTLDRVDAVWLLGPYPVGLVFVLLALLRRKPIALGVRQDLVRYARSRHPNRRWTHVAAFLLDGAYRLLGRRFPVVVVGPDLASRYRAAPRLLPVSVSLVRDADLVDPTSARARRYDGELQILSVGRLETEKNPLLLADVLALLRRRDERWNLVVCGEGPMKAELEARLRELGVAQHAHLRGYVPIHEGLGDLYRQSHALLHVSWTEGLPQILFEAFAAGLPVVATAVGGVPAAAGDAALLVPPGDPEAAASALSRVGGDEAVRARLIDSGGRLVRAHTIEAECARVARFLSDGFAR